MASNYRSFNVFMNMLSLFHNNDLNAFIEFISEVLFFIFCDFFCDFTFLRFYF